MVCVHHINTWPNKWTVVWEKQKNKGEKKEKANFLLLLLQLHLLLLFVMNSSFFVWFAFLFTDSSFFFFFFFFLLLLCLSSFSSSFWWLCGAIFCPEVGFGRLLSDGYQTSVCPVDRLSVVSIHGHLSVDNCWAIAAAILSASVGQSPPPFGCCSTNRRHSRPLLANRHHDSAAVRPPFRRHDSAVLSCHSAAVRPPLQPLFGYHFSRCLATTWPLSGGFKEASDLSKPMRREILDILALSKFGVIFTNCNYFIIFLTLINHRHKPNISSSKKTSWMHKLLHDNEDIQGIIILT